MEEDTPKENKVELLCSLWNNMTINEQKSACELLNLYSVNDITFRNKVLSIEQVECIIDSKENNANIESR